MLLFVILMGCQWLKISYVLVRVDRTSKKDNQKRAGKRLFTMSSIDPIVLKVCAAPPVLLFWLDGIRVSNLCRLLCCSSIFYTRRPCEHIPFCTIYLPRLAWHSFLFNCIAPLLPRRLTFFYMNRYSVYAGRCAKKCCDLQHCLTCQLFFNIFYRRCENTYE